MIGKVLWNVCLYRVTENVTSIIKLCGHLGRDWGTKT